MTNKPIKKILVILIAIVLIPGLSFSVYEMLSFNENEEVIRNIYTDQLETILFSVNQYSNDIVSGWESQISNILHEPVKEGVIHSNRVNEFLELNRSLKHIILFDSSSFNFAKIIPESNEVNDRNIIESTARLLKGNEKIIRRLFTYSTGGYQKIEPAAGGDSPGGQVLFFIVKNKNQSRDVCALVVNPQQFISEVLRPKIQETAREKFVISTSKGTQKSIWTGEQSQITSEVFKELWLFPEYKISISPIGRSIEGLVKERTTKSLILILLLTAALITAVIFIFRLIKKEVMLAQIKTDFVSNVSHELRTPLALITMYSETLEMNRVKTEEKKQEYYKIISQEANRLSRIVNSILSFSKIEAGKRVFNFQNMELISTIENILINYESHLNGSGCACRFEKERDKIFISADKEAVGEALLNLLDNAVKYSDSNKLIIISAGIDKNNAFVSVKDFGIGISEENQKKIFEKFFRESTGFVHNSKGTGLGLTIVQHIMNAHKGRITLESRKGNGSKFTLLFPIKN